MAKRLNPGLLILLTLISVTVITSCKRYVDPPPYFEEDSIKPKPNNRKVVVIAIDGAIGSEYKQILAPVLEGLKAHSKYSWDAVSDEVTTDGASIKTMFSGVSYFRHRIVDSSFIYSQPVGSAPHATPTTFPSFYNYILSSAYADLNTAFVTTWNDVLQKLVPEVETKVLAANDAGVKDSAIARIKDPKSDFIAIHFNGVAIAGKQFGFSSANTGYKDAVLKVDGYIGEIMTALKSRTDYKSEEWLVIINGTHGGNGNSYGGSSQKETNVISFYYNDNFKPVEFVKSGFTGVQIKGTATTGLVRAQVLNDNGLYNPGTGQQTIQIKIKGTAGAYPHFFSKQEKAFTSGIPGWSMFTAGSSWAISIRSTTSGENRIQGATPNVFDNNWHTITAVFADSGSKRWLRRYTDGNRTDQTDITAAYNSGGTYFSTSPLTIGWGTDQTMPAVTIYTADAMIFDKALSDNEIKDNVCLTNITAHPSYANLIGYWPCNDGFGGKFANNAPTGAGKDFILSGPFGWDIPNLYPCTTPVVPAGANPMLMKSVDVASTLFYWLKIPTNPSWNFEGNATWLSLYEREFVK